MDKQIIIAVLTQAIKVRTVQVNKLRKVDALDAAYQAGTITVWQGILKQINSGDLTVIAKNNSVGDWFELYYAFEIAKKAIPAALHQTKLILN